MNVYGFDWLPVGLFTLSVQMPGMLSTTGKINVGVVTLETVGAFNFPLTVTALPLGGVKVAVEFGSMFVP